MDTISAGSVLLTVGGGVFVVVFLWVLLHALRGLTFRIPGLRSRMERLTAGMGVSAIVGFLGVMLILKSAPSLADGSATLGKGTVYQWPLFVACLGCMTGSAFLTFVFWFVSAPSSGIHRGGTQILQLLHLVPPDLRDRRNQ